MRNYDDWKTIIKYISSCVILSLEILVYWYVWINYYNGVLKYPFWRRGNWLMVALYASILLFFLRTYGGLKIGYLKKGNIILSQVLALFFTNSITYVQIALIDKKFHNIFIMMGITILDIILVIVWTLLFDNIYRYFFPPRKLLIIYGDYPMFHIMDKINTREDKYQISTTIHISQGLKKIIKLAEEFDGVVIGDITAHERNKLLKVFFEKNIRVYAIPKISDILIRTSTELNLFDTPLILSRNTGLKIEQRIIKRLIDIMFSAVGLLLSSPIFLLIAIAIKCTDKGKIIYKQERYTLNKKVFMIYKFRTMCIDAEKDGVPRLAQQEDNRITRIGKILRASRLDELPQLYNILIGDMSVVGPRPERPEIAEEYEEEIPEFAYRLKVKAGLTGYAQLYGKYNTTPYDKLKLDLTYILNYSLLLDLKLIFTTPKIILMKESTEGIALGQITATLENTQNEND